jgi:hypothetical protein
MHFSAVNFLNEKRRLVKTALRFTETTANIARNLSRWQQLYLSGSFSVVLFWKNTLWLSSGSALPFLFLVYVKRC